MSLPSLTLVFCWIVIFLKSLTFSWNSWHLSWNSWHLSWKSWHFPEKVDNSLNFILSKSLNYEELFVSLYSKNVRHLITKNIWTFKRYSNIIRDPWYRTCARLLSRLVVRWQLQPTTNWLWCTGIFQKSLEIAKARFENLIEEE